MERKIPKAFAKITYAPILAKRSDDDNSRESEKVKNKIFRGSYRKLIRNVKYITTAVSFLMTLLKLFQELGLIP
ncbi:MAG: hypothetical protein RM338_23890 [Nostoc sp. DedQUE12a]|nr:hypothetical protein [Nostoc sp. DedQUE12a]